MSFYNKIAGQKVQRIEALSDGVFAIAMTIMVFDLKDPVSNVVNSDLELLISLKKILPNLLTYLLSFMTLGIFWTGQSTQFNYVSSYNRQLNWLSLFFLLFVTLLPFSTTLLSHHINNATAVLIYWFNILAMGLLLLIHWKSAIKRNCLSFGEDNPKLVAKAISNRILIAQSLYAGAASLCFLNTYASIICIILIQLNYALGILPAGKKNT